MHGRRKSLGMRLTWSRSLMHTCDCLMSSGGTYMHTYFTFYSLCKQRKKRGRYSTELTNDRQGSQSNGSSVNGSPSAESSTSPSENTRSNGNMMTPPTNFDTRPLIDSSTSQDGGTNSGGDMPLVTFENSISTYSSSTPSPQPSSPPTDPHQKTQKLETSVKGGHNTLPTHLNPESPVEESPKINLAASNMLNCTASELEPKTHQSTPVSSQGSPSQLETIARQEEPSTPPPRPKSNESVQEHPSRLNPAASVEYSMLNCTASEQSTPVPSQESPSQMARQEEPSTPPPRPKTEPSVPENPCGFILSHPAASNEYVKLECTTSELEHSTPLSTHVLSQESPEPQEEPSTPPPRPKPISLPQYAGPNLDYGDHVSPVQIETPSTPPPQPKPISLQYAGPNPRVRYSNHAPVPQSQSNWSSQSDPALPTELHGEHSSTSSTEYFEPHPDHGPLLSNRIPAANLFGSDDCNPPINATPASDSTTERVTGSIQLYPPQAPPVPPPALQPVQQPHQQQPPLQPQLQPQPIPPPTDPNTGQTGRPRQ